jgi:hypothetical protein
MIYKSNFEPKFKGYLIIYDFDDGSLSYLLNSLEIGENFCSMSFLDETYTKKKLSLIEEDFIDEYIKKNITNKHFRIKTIIPVFMLDNKTFLDKPITL